MPDWEVVYGPEFVPEYDALDGDVQEELVAHLVVLAQEGPKLGRPLVDTLKRSDHANMKELRFSLGRQAWRFAFAFDPKRRAVVLVGGDKAGRDPEAVLQETDRGGGRTFFRAPRPNEGKEIAMARQRTLKTVLANMAPARRKRVLDRADEIGREVQALQELRKARSKTQAEVAKQLDATQPYVAKLEQRSDLMLSVLRKYVRSVGGELELSVTFPDSGRVILSGIGEREKALRKPRSRRKRSDRPAA